MYQLEEQKYFYYFAAVVVLIVAFLLVAFWKKRKQKTFADPKLLERLSPELSPFKSTLKIIMVALGLTFLTIAAEDILPSRLEKSKQIISKIIDKLGSDRVGIIIYAGNSYPLLPITTDHAAAKMFLQNANPDMVSSQGTAINEALKLAKSYYDDDDQTNRYLFVISDGEDHAENVSYITEEATKENINIYTIGVGTSKGGPIPIKREDTLLGYKKDREGEVVITKLNDNTLKEIASEGKGEYLFGNNVNKTVEYIDELLLAADKKEFETKQFSDYKDQFQWFVGLGLLFLIFDALMFNKKTKWIQQLNLFNDKKRD